MTIPAPAGWYPDVEHRHERRYWDGTQWTDQVSDAGRTLAEPLSTRAPVAWPVAYFPAKFYASTGFKARFPDTDVTVQVSEGAVALVAPRVPADRWRHSQTVYRVIVLCAVVVMAASLTIAVAIGEGSAAGVLLFAGFLVPALAVSIVALVWKTTRRRIAVPDVVIFPAAAIGRIDLRYNWNGTAWCILLGLLPWIIVGVAMGRKVISFRAPLDPGEPPRLVRLKLHDAAEGAALARAIQMAATSAWTSPAAVSG